MNEPVVPGDAAGLSAEPLLSRTGGPAPARAPERGRGHGDRSEAALPGVGAPPRRRWKLVTPDELRSVEILSALGEPELQAVARACRPRRVDEDETIIRHGERTTDVYFLLDGTLRVKMYSSTARYITFEKLEAGSMVGEFAAVDGAPRSASVVAETPCYLAQVSGPAFKRLLDETPALAAAVLARVVAVARWLANKVHEYHAYSVKGRVYLELLREARKVELRAEHPIAIGPLCDADLASRIGSGRENVNRIISELRDADVLYRVDRIIYITDLAKLRALLSDQENR